MSKLVAVILLILEALTLLNKPSMVYIVHNYLIYTDRIKTNWYNNIRYPGIVIKSKYFKILLGNVIFTDKVQLRLKL